ncbi:hypothetical protein [Methanococcoides methylutens]|uniref:hypothetical protein n=1 Tax=Methanococcoides methylutens TaxID=2226 RepID=UPI0012E08412|nr:hypothetical protein [Methanococcoides methylutens]
MANVRKSAGKLAACVFYGFFLFSFLTKIYYNLFHPEFVAGSFQYSPLYSSGDQYRSLVFSTVGNIFFSILCIYGIIRAIKSD